MVWYLCNSVGEPFSSVHAETRIEAEEHASRIAKQYPERGAVTVRPHWTDEEKKQLLLAKR